MTRIALPAQETWIQGTLAALLAVLVLVPLAILLATSLSEPGTLPFERWSVTLANFRAILLDPQALALLRNTAVYAAGSMAFGVTLATGLAWLTERTDLPGRNLVRVVLFTWMAVPPVIVGFGWVLLLNPGNGALNVASRALFGGGPPFTIYSMWAMVFSTGLSVLPTAHVMIAGLLRNMDPQLEDAAAAHGAGAVAVARRVTLPLLTPGLVSVGIFMLIAVVQAFDLPVIVGLTARIPVLSTRIYLLSSPDTGIPNYGLAAAFGVLLLLVALVLMAAYFRIVGTGERYRVVGGKAFRPRLRPLGPWKILTAIGTFALLAVMIAPLLITLWASAFPFYRTPSLAALPGASLDVYRRVLALPSVGTAVVNTLVLVLASATIVMAMSTAIAWLSVTRRTAAARLLEVLSFLPSAVPPIVMSVAILLLYLRTPLYGTLAVLVVGHVTIYTAFGVRTMSSALIQLNRELTDAALVSGATWLTAFRRIVLPLVWPQWLGGWLWVVAHSARDLTIPLLLVSSSNLVVASLAWTLWNVPDLPGAAALSMMLVGVLILVVAPLQVLAERAVRRFG